MKLQREAEKEYRLQDYAPRPAIEGVRFAALRRFHDESGAMTEILRLAAAPDELAGFRPAQINYSVLRPGAIKAFHLHLRQTDVWFVPPEDRVLLVLVDVREDSPSAGTRVRRVLGDGASELVRIPPGVAHGCRNVGSEAARILYLTDRVFSPSPPDCDEGRLPWDHAGAEIWEEVRE